MRKLATIRKISDIKPIEDADRIELAIVDGWQCVVKKGEFNIGDLCLYIEIDSIIKPDKKWSEFLKDKNKSEKLIRIKTRKFKGQISQGLILPLNILNEYGSLEYDKINKIYSLVFK